MSRRRVLGGSILASGMAASAGVLLAQPAAAAAAVIPQQYYDVRSNGAVGDGTTDDTAAFRKTISRASAAGGGIVEVPAGTYRITGSLTLPDGVSLEGVGWHSPRPSDSPNFNGSWIFVTATGASPIQFTKSTAGRGSAVRRLAFNYPGQSAASPVQYAPTINMANVDDVTLEDLHLYNSYDGIIVGNCGRLKAERISGQPLHIGMQFDQVHDTIYINDIHFWPFWAQTAGLGYLQWSLDNGVAINCLDVDNPMFSNIFALGYLTAINFGASSSGVTSKFHLQNADLDGNQYGIQVSGANTTGQMSNVTAQGPNGVGYNGLYITGIGSTVFCANLRITAVQDNAIRIESGAGSARLVIHGFWTDNWNQSGGGFPAIEIVSGNSTAMCYLGVGNFFQNGGGAPSFSAPVASQIQQAQTAAVG